MILFCRLVIKFKDSFRWGPSMSLNQIKIHQSEDIILRLRLTKQNQRLGNVSFYLMREIQNISCQSLKASQDFTTKMRISTKSRWTSPWVLSISSHQFKDHLQVLTDRSQVSPWVRKSQEPLILRKRLILTEDQSIQVHVQIINTLHHLVLTLLTRWTSVPNISSNQNKDHLQINIDLSIVRHHQSLRVVSFIMKPHLTEEDQTSLHHQVILLNTKLLPATLLTRWTLAINISRLRAKLHVSQSTIQTTLSFPLDKSHLQLPSDNQLW